MTIKPMIFSGPMIRALLDGRKSQTRRILKPQPEQNSAGLWVYPPYSHKITKKNWHGFCQADEEGLRRFATRHAPYQSGDLLWCREAWRPQMDKDLWCCVEYRADGSRIKPKIKDDNMGECFAAQCHAVDPDLRKHGIEPEPLRWRPPIHMPKWASRLTLRVTGVRVERVQDINGDALREEGLDIPPGPPLSPRETEYWRPAFADLWNSIHGPDAWSRNDWVAAVSFLPILKNVDEVTA